MKKSKYGMPPPQNRGEMEHNIYLVVEDGNRKIDSGNKDLIQNFVWATYPHLREVKNLPNGRVNLATINEMIRLQANTRKWMESMPEQKRKSNEDIPQDTGDNEAI